MTESMVRNKPGMASVKDMPVLQDGPPPGGFAPVRYARRIPNKGPSAIALFLTTFGAFSWGMYQVGQGNKVRRALKEEKIAARSAILPMLQAEEDERFVKEWKKYLEEEARIMKNVPGWKVGESVYNSGKWMPPATGELRPEVCSCHISLIGVITANMMVLAEKATAVMHNSAFAWEGSFSMASSSCTQPAQWCCRSSPHDNGAAAYPLGRALIICCRQLHTVYNPHRFPSTVPPHLPSIHPFLSPAHLPSSALFIRCHPAPFLPQLPCRCGRAVFADLLQARPRTFCKQDRRVSCQEREKEFWERARDYSEWVDDDTRRKVESASGHSRLPAVEGSPPPVRSL
ncbi:hypothetical protein TRIUR3_11800 [Triticum urartu]|uniref:NADH dehydrogenase [ubiquinone] 1 alpha subcomplex subunit 13-B n=1 Tax=Triticum urartu TaxID=4572 RepID=M7Z669_TRIUA|nr:hypothetical protein TRIUR3_11800 [Triticum urartu]